MDRKKIEELRTRVSCATLLLQAGFTLDEHESSRRALKFRRGADIVIVTHGGSGWFDPLSDKKGDVFTLASLLDGTSFAAAVERLGALVGIHYTPPKVIRDPSAARRPSASIAERWQRKTRITPVSGSFRYLTEDRALPYTIIEIASRDDLIRQGPLGSAWFRHADENGGLSGWEERGPQWRGFSRDGAKTLFGFGSRRAIRICVTEAAIDALSLATLEEARSDTLYASTGGGWSPSTARVIETVAAGAMLVAATDADPQGEAFADRLRHIAEVIGCDFSRLRPTALDWNEELKERRGRGEVAQALMPASRVKLRPPDGGP